MLKCPKPDTKTPQPLTLCPKQDMHSVPSFSALVIATLGFQPVFWRLFGAQTQIVVLPTGLSGTQLKAPIPPHPYNCLFTQA